MNTYTIPECPEATALDKAVREHEQAKFFAASASRKGLQRVAGMLQNAERCARLRMENRAEILVYRLEREIIPHDLIPEIVSVYCDIVRGIERQRLGVNS